MKTEKDYPDIRRVRAEPLVASIMRVLADVIPHGRKQEAYHSLLDAFMGWGIEVLTDQRRHEVGLPPRGDLGWTPQELNVLEAKMLEALKRHVAPAADSTAKSDDSR